METSIQTVAVIGCGVIGSSWASLFMARGLKVIISDPAPQAKQTFEHYLKDAWAALENAALDISGTPTNYEFVNDISTWLSEVDWVQENGPEEVALKTKLLAEIDGLVRRDVVIASSSSGLPSSQFIQSCKNNPNRVLIGHPFNPPHLIPLVEVVPHQYTEKRSIKTAVDFYTTLGKRPILLNHETPGFVANRLQAALNNEAYSLISRGVVSAGDLDAAITNGPGLRWALTGPIVTNSLGGGGGRDGFSKRLDRLGPAIQEWEKDMQEHRFDWSPLAVQKLVTGVEEWLSQTNLSQIEKERDYLLLGLLALKSKLQGTAS